MCLFPCIISAFIIRSGPIETAGAWSAKHVRPAAATPAAISTAGTSTTPAALSTAGESTTPAAISTAGESTKHAPAATAVRSAAAAAAAARVFAKEERADVYARALC